MINLLIFNYLSGNSRPSDALFPFDSYRGLRCAHPRLSPFGFRLRGHAFQATRQHDVCNRSAVNIAGYQFITFIRHLTYNRASGCNFNNPLLTASVAKSATWGKPRSLKTTTVERLQTQRRGQIRILYGRRRCRCPQIALR